MALMNCPKCGYTISLLASNCPSCGVSISNADSPSMNKGECIFGNYKSGFNGEIAPIKWIILDKQEDKMLLLSKFSLDCRIFDPRYGTGHKNNWSISYIRAWLNDVFYSAAFNSEEKKKIIATITEPHSNPKFQTYQGKACEDKVFLLSVKEAEIYLKDANIRSAKCTGYCCSRNPIRHDDGSCFWWLRTMGKDQDNAVGIYSINGTIHYQGSCIDFDDNTVRPAIWIKKQKDF